MAGRRSNGVVLSSSLERTYALGQKLAPLLEKGQVVALLGQLGSGKTTFAKGVITKLSSIASDEVHSPTFTYLNVYEAPFPIYHFDLYRLPNEQAFFQMGFLDYLDAAGICLIEWAERIWTLLPKETLCIHFEHVEEGKRKIYVTQKNH